jgi:hypothetical protein
VDKYIIFNSKRQPYKLIKNSIIIERAPRILRDPNILEEPVLRIKDEFKSKTKDEDIENKELVNIV